MSILTIKQEVFRQIADLLRDAMPNPGPALALGELSQDFKIQIEENSRVIAEFPHAQLCTELLRARQVDVPTGDVAKRMVEVAGIKKPTIVGGQDQKTETSQGR